MNRRSHQSHRCRRNRRYRQNHPTHRSRRYRRCHRNHRNRQSRRSHHCRLIHRSRHCHQNRQNHPNRRNHHCRHCSAGAARSGTSSLYRHLRGGKPETASPGASLRCGCKCRCCRYERLPRPCCPGHKSCRFLRLRHRGFRPAPTDWFCRRMCCLQPQKYPLCRCRSARS